MLEMQQQGLHPATVAAVDELRNSAAFCRSTAKQWHVKQR
jgi:hypothetical protein